MKKLIKILLLTLLFIGCSADDTNKQSKCDCVTTYYTIDPGQSSYQWYGVSPSPDLDCSDATETKVYTGNANVFYQVTCK